ncbi:MAG: hypothetical protein Q7R49_05935 [Candidatus Daviesbacteria bacterium]|nr:hypothetical protein [Candidatus Daviesbacteria bacterium]
MTPEANLNLNDAWLKNADQLAYLYAKELGYQSKDEYMDSLPEFDKERFETPVIVQVPQGKLTLARMLAIQGITKRLPNLRDLKDWQKDPQKFRTPKTPYVTYLHDGSRNLNKTPAIILENLASDERGGTIFDGLALLAKKPDILIDHFIDLPGSQYAQYGPVCFPYLYQWDGKVYLDRRLVITPNSLYGSIIAARNIVTK